LSKKDIVLQKNNINLWLDRLKFSQGDNMDWGVFVLSNLFFKGQGSAWFFVFFLILVFLSALLNFILCLCKSEYTILKRVWAVVFVGGINLTFLGVCFAFSFQISLFLLLLGLSLVLISPTFCISVKRKPKKEQLIRLSRLIDKKAKEQELSVRPTIQVEKVLHEENCSCEKGQTKADNTCDLDFEHVKNVIDRLEYYPLSQADRRQVSELEGYIRSAEREGVNEYFKSKINDGLGVLLKLMSKYGF
jgi:hypothetical protein